MGLENFTHCADNVDDLLAFLRRQPDSVLCNYYDWCVAGPRDEWDCRCGRLGKYTRGEFDKAFSGRDT
jgi:hypothetical protein